MHILNAGTKHAVLLVLSSKTLGLGGKPFSGFTDRGITTVLGPTSAVRCSRHAIFWELVISLVGSQVRATKVFVA